MRLFQGHRVSGIRVSTFRVPEPSVLSMGVSKGVPQIAGLATLAIEADRNLWERKFQPEANVQPTARSWGYVRLEPGTSARFCAETPDRQVLHSVLRARIRRLCGRFWFVRRFIRRGSLRCGRFAPAPTGPDLPRGGDAVHRHAAACRATRCVIWPGVLPRGASACHGESPHSPRKARDLQTPSGGQPRSHGELDSRSQRSFVRRATEPLVAGQREPVSDLPSMRS
jgi:hypothetical protein